MSGALPLGHTVKGAVLPKGDLPCFIAAAFILPTAALFPCTPCRPALLKQGGIDSSGKCITVGLTSYYKQKKIYSLSFGEKKENTLQVVLGHLQE